MLQIRQESPKTDGICLPLDPCASQLGQLPHLEIAIAKGVFFGYLEQFKTSLGIFIINCSLDVFWAITSPSYSLKTDEEETLKIFFY